MKIAAPFLAIGLIAAAGSAGAAPQGSDAGSPLVGTWRLVAYSDTPAGGSPVYPFGQNPSGIFQFGPEGIASINIMRNPPNPTGPTVSTGLDACQPAWYCSYYGHYTVDPARGRWTMHVEGGNVPTYLNTDQTRGFRVEGDRLIMSSSYEVNGGTVTAERVLQRVR
ncbi:lipocalin-like domain-containing protein [Flavisphingomonas formosensis]|uniref:lipocalin-like domain-containing protein n=1 Tax=Flavisphingomonas formosensis TaxID=861534 RepID=UPI0012FA1B8A|nr:lipocalin-like domain-containing protein [Sphingomonas formosensis]